jgi:pimeloyl-ACP methyl ester carboxylesterase
MRRDPQAVGSSRPFRREHERQPNVHVSRVDVIPRRSDRRARRLQQQRRERLAHALVHPGDARQRSDPDATYKGGVRRFPNLVPDSPDAEGAALSRRARDWFRTEWTGKTFLAVGMKDPVLGPPAMRYLARQVRGCPPPYEVAEGGHFLQEWGSEVARRALAAL